MYGRLQENHTPLPGLTETTRTSSKATQQKRAETPKTKPYPYTTHTHKRYRGLALTRYCQYFIAIKGVMGCRRAESAGSSALVTLRALLRVRPGLVQSSEALPPEGAVYDVMKASSNARQQNRRGAPPPHSHKGKHHTKGGKQHRGNPPANTHPTADPLEEGRGATIGGAVKRPSDFRVKEHPLLVAPQKSHPPLIAPKKNHPPLVASKKNHPPLRAYMATGRPRSLKPAHESAPHSASMVASSVAHATSRATAPHRSSNFVSSAALTLKPSE